MDLPPPSPTTTDSSVIALDGDPRLLQNILNPLPSTTPVPLPPPPPTTKPRSTKQKPRSPSPSPPPPAPPTPLQTIRLQITLGGQEDYAVDVAELAKKNGMRLLMPVVPVNVGHSDDEDEEKEKEKDKDKDANATEGGMTTDGEGGRKKKKK
ncbi:hypothetical protein H0H93_002618, partial [Arthromyces matolae]